MTEPDALWERLRAEGAQHLDPVRFHYIAQLQQRLAAATDALRPLIAPKRDAALADYAARWDAARASARNAVAAVLAREPAQGREARRLFALGQLRGVHQLDAVTLQAAGTRPLAQLVAQGRPNDAAAQAPRKAVARPEMHSVQRFRQTWSRIAAQEAVDLAVDRAPANAGPLNSQVLTLRSLAWMREISPDYLRRFLAHAQTLLWLEQASQRPTSAEAKPARRARGRQK